MEDPFGAGEVKRKKADGVTDAVNRLVQNLIIKCAKSEGVRDYYHVGVIGYGGDKNPKRVGPALAGTLAGRGFVPLSEISPSHARIEERNKKVDDGAGGLVDQKVKFRSGLMPSPVAARPCAKPFERLRRSPLFGFLNIRIASP